MISKELFMQFIEDEITEVDTFFDRKKIDLSTKSHPNLWFWGCLKHNCNRAVKLELEWRKILKDNA